MRFDQSTHEFEVAAGVLVGPEVRRQYLAGRIVNGQVQVELGIVITQPAVVTAVDLGQHALPGHAFPPYPVPGWTPPPRALDAGRGQDPPQGLAADPDRLALCEQLGKVGVVGVRVAVPGQLDHPGGNVCGNRVARVKNDDYSGRSE